MAASGSCKVAESQLAATDATVTLVWDAAARLAQNMLDFWQEATWDWTWPPVCVCIRDLCLDLGWDAARGDKGSLVTEIIRGQG